VSLHLAGIPLKLWQISQSPRTMVFRRSRQTASVEEVRIIHLILEVLNCLAVPAPQPEEASHA